MSTPPTSPGTSIPPAIVDNNALTGALRTLKLGGMLQTSAFAQDLKDSKLNGSSASGGKFELPLLQSPSKVFKLLLGQDVDLFKWDVPALDLNLEIHKTFPLLGPIGVTFGGESAKFYAEFRYHYVWGQEVRQQGSVVPGGPCEQGCSTNAQYSQINFGVRF